MLRFGLLSKGANLPRANLLAYYRANSITDAYGSYDITAVSNPSDTVLTAGHTYSLHVGLRAALGSVDGVDHWAYSDAGVQKVVSYETIQQNGNDYNFIVSTTKGTAVYDIAAQTTAIALKADKVLKRLPYNQPTVFYNGLLAPTEITAEGGTYTGGPTVFADNLGALQTVPSGMPALQGMRFTGGAYFDTTSTGTPLLPSANQPTRTFDAEFTTSTPATTYKKYTRTNPSVDLPGYLCEPARTNYALNSAAPATHTTGTIPVGTYTLWQDGTGSITATAGTAVGTFGTASNGTPATITITTAGTVVLTASGTNTWVQLELGAFATSRITTASAAVTRQGTVLSFPTLGKIRNNDIAFKLSAVPRGAGQSGYLWGSYTNASNFTYLSIGPYDITFKSVVNGFSQDLAIASYTHKADTPFEVILCKSTRGSQLLVREYSGGTWQPWVRGGFSVASDNLVVGSAYTLGAFNNAGQFAGNISELDSLLIPAGIANPVTWVESQWGVNGAGSNPVIFNHTFTGLTLLDGVLRTKSASDSVTINWGDGTSDTYSGTADTAFTHTYASSTTVYNVTYTASDNSVLTKIAYTDRAGGKVGGVLSLPAVMTYFLCYGSNTLSGVLSLPAGMKAFYCSGSNTLSGVLSLPAVMTYFNCWGYNTLSGVLSLPAGMASFTCGGSNTLSGALSMPAVMTYFTCGGSNTLSGYTPSTKASNQRMLTITGLNTLSAANVDAIINDYAAAGGTWTGEKAFTMTVLTASNRTAASDAAWATLGTKGLVTRTITLR